MRIHRGHYAARSQQRAAAAFTAGQPGRQASSAPTERRLERTASAAAAVAALAERSPNRQRRHRHAQ